jgi:hypothetical protein
MIIAGEILPRHGLACSVGEPAIKLPCARSLHNAVALQFANDVYWVGEGIAQVVGAVINGDSRQMA